MNSPFVETASTLTNTTVTIAANPRRKGLVIGNPSDTVMTARIGGSAATAAIGIPVPAGGHLAFMDTVVPDGAVSLFCAGTSKAYTIYEW
jgi:FAD/FMN-containing dehydrogenase